MIYQDYIMRMIGQLVRVLAKVLFNIETGNYREASDEINTALKGLTGLDYNFLKDLSDIDIISLLKISEDNEVTGAKCFITGKLIKEAAGLNKKEINDFEINMEYEKALSLYLEGILSNKEQSELFSEYFKDIDIILKTLGNDIPARIRLKLFKYYEITGLYGNAEKELIILENLNYFDVKKEGINFYEKLDKMTDDELSRRNFTREIVKEKLELLNKKE